MYNTILVPTDGGEHAVRAAEHARYLARVFDAAVHLVAVVDIQGAAGVFSAGGVDREFVRRLEREAEAALDDAEAAVEGGTTIRRAVLRGKPSDAVLEYVEDNDVDLVAMGTHGRTGVRRYIAGSVTERVLRLADVPVLTVRAADRSRVEGDYEDVLVPTDGSDEARAAVAHAVAIAEHTGARLHAVSVVDVPDVAVGPGAALPPELTERIEATARDATEAIARTAREAGLDVVTDVFEGTPTRGLLRYVEDNDVDLVVMGTHGRTGLDRLVLGSTTVQLVRHADVPILAAKRGKAAGAEG